MRGRSCVKVSFSATAFRRCQFYARVRDSDAAIGRAQRSGLFRRTENLSALEKVDRKWKHMKSGVATWGAECHVIFVNYNVLSFTNMED